MAQTFTRYSKAVVSFLLLLVFAGITTNAQWTYNPSVNTPIIPSSITGRSGSHQQQVADGNGGYFVVWVDGDINTGANKIAVQHFNASGVAQWASTGVYCAPEDKSYSPNPTIIADGTGGAIVAWQAEPGGNYTTPYYIQAQRISASGALLWGASGQLIAQAPIADGYFNASLLGDGAGGAIVFWCAGQINTGNTGHVYYDAQYITASKTFPWGSSPKQFYLDPSENYPQNGYPYGFTTDGSGGAYVTYNDHNSNTILSHIDVSGNIWSSPKTITNSFTNPLNGITTDGSGGVVVIYASSNSKTLYAQRYNSSGVAQWGTNVIASLTFSQFYTMNIANDGVGGYYVAVEGYNGTNTSAKIQHLTSAGAPTMGSAGIQPYPGGSPAYPKFIAGNGGTGILVWADGGANPSGVYAQEYNSTGTAQWPVTGNGDGVWMITGGNSQSSCSDGAGGVIAVADLNRISIYYLNLYAQKLSSNGLLASSTAAPTSTSVAGSFTYTTPNTFNVGTAITPLTPTQNAYGTSSVGYGFNSLIGLAADANGNLFVSDNSYTLNKIAPNGTITTLTGNQLANNYFIGAIAVDGSGNIFYCSQRENIVKKVTYNGNGTYSASANYCTGFSNLNGGICVDKSGNVYVTDWGNNTVYKITSGVKSPIGTTGGWNAPWGIAADASGNVYVADYNHNAIKKIASNGTTVTTVYSGSDNPTGVALDASGNIYYSCSQGTVNKVTSSSTKTLIGSFAGNNSPLAIDASGSLYTTKASGINKIAVYGSAYKFKITPDLPAGLSFNTTNGTISGTPSVVTTTSSYTVIGAFSGGLATTNLNIATTAPIHVWTGNTSTDFSVATNWSGNVLPPSTEAVSIPSTASRQPVLSANTTISGIVFTGAGTLSLNGKTLTLNGEVIGSAGYLISNAASSLVVNGVANTVNFSTTANQLNNITINSGGYITLGDSVKLYGTLNSNGGTIHTGNGLVLVSNSAGTAVVGPVYGNIYDRVTVQRYIPNTWSGYRDIGVSVYGNDQQLNYTWLSSLPKNYSMFDYVNGTWSSSLSSNTFLFPMVGYRTLVTAGSTLNANGYLVMGNQSPTLTGGQDAYSFISNPYASQVDFSQLSSSGLYDGYFYFDPTYVTSGINYLYVHYSISTGSSNVFTPSSIGINKYIQPGQGFFVCSNTSGTPSLTFTESAKSNGTTQTAIFGTQAPLNRIAAGLFTNNTNLDGAVTVFNNNFTNEIGGEDALKIYNSGENLTFLVAGKDLCANGWKTPKANDELQLHLTQLKANTSYSIRLDVSQFSNSGLDAYLKDNVSGTQTLLSGVSDIKFTTTATDAASFSNRYSILFGASALPVKSINLAVSALPNNQLSIKWTTAGESNVSNYKVTRSVDGTHFTNLATVSPSTSHSYSFVDATASKGINYYRIEAVDNVGTISYSKVVSVSSVYHSSLSVYPNPVTGNSFKVALDYTGKYTVDVVNLLGQKVYSTVVNHTSVGSLENVILTKKLATGNYQLRAVGEDGKINSTELIIK